MARPSAPDKQIQVLLALLCGLLSFLLDFWIIPGCFARGVPDPVWMALMVLLPVLAAVGLLHILRPCRPRYVFFGLLVQWAILLLFARPVGAMVGFRLGGLAQDLFDWIAYGIFALGWSLGATLAQFFALCLMRRPKR